MGRFIPKCQYDIKFNERTERTFYPSVYFLELMRREPEIYYMLGAIANEVILNPEMVQLNFRVLKHLKNFYYWNPQSRPYLTGPILALLNNIGAFSLVIFSFFAIFI